jgi:opacity protein-like surface antigen
MKRIIAIATLVAVFMVPAGAALAEPSPPTNGGNGAGQSGQCTGPQDDRPASCQSQGGPGNQP